ncbi:unnamed protein product [Lepidochelys olivacea]
MLHLQVASPTLALLSLLLLLVALGSDHWLLLKENQVVMHSGLWKLCMNLGCLIPLNVPDLINASRACLILAVIAGLLSCLALLASFFCSHLGSVSLTLVSAMGSFSAGFCILIALTVFTSEFAEVMKVTWLHVSFGWSWGLGWASIPLFLLTGGVTLLAQESNSI